jgi:hypothetical protein
VLSTDVSVRTKEDGVAGADRLRVPGRFKCIFPGGAKGIAAVATVRMMGSRPVMNPFCRDIWVKVLFIA